MQFYLGKYLLYLTYFIIRLKNIEDSSASVLSLKSQMIIMRCFEIVFLLYLLLALEIQSPNLFHFPGNAKKEEEEETYTLQCNPFPR